MSNSLFPYFRALPFISSLLFFFFNDTATTEIYTLSLHDALPISSYHRIPPAGSSVSSSSTAWGGSAAISRDRKSTRLNSSHGYISYAVFCLKKKKKILQSLTQDNRTHTD